MFDFSGKKVFITGSSRGIGKAIAKDFYAQGAKVCLAGSNEENLRSVAEEFGGGVSYVVSDLSVEKGASTAAVEAREKLGGLDVLVNNAGVTKDGLLLSMKDKDFLHVLEMNLFSVFRLTKSILAGMMKQRYGRIINISSVTGVSGQAGQVNYASSKAGLIGFSKSLAAEMASRSITVNSVAPGFIETDMTEKLSDQQKGAILSRIPVGYMGQPSDISACVLYLASQEARYVTGQTFHVNGGLLMV